MTFSDSGLHSKIELTPEQMLAISREISFKFSPNKASIVDNGELFPDHYPLINPLFAKDETNAELTSEAYSQNGFSFKELNDISREISRRFAPKASTLEPELFLLPVDPLHLYVYWDIGENTARITPDGGFENDLTLRIYWRPDENPEIKCSNVWFDLSADNPERRQKVRLPIDDTAYSATLGKLNPDNSIDPLAHSNIIHVPPAPGRIMKTQVLNNLNNNLPVSDFPNAFKTSEQDSLDASKFSYEEPPIVKDIQVSLYEKLNEGPHFPEHGWFVKLHFNDSFAYNGDTSKINAEFMAFLNKKGINVELIPERPFIEYSTYQGKNASGQGM